MIKILKSIQFVTSIGVVILFWQIYPGVMVLFASIVGLCYVAAAVGAIFDNRIAIWFAFAFSVLTSILSSLAVSRFLQCEFNFLTGNWGKSDEFYLYPYLLVIIFLISVFVVIMHTISWKWVIQRNQGVLK